MKHLIYLFTALLFVNTSYAQFNLGLRVGLHTSSTELLDELRPTELANMSLDGKIGFRGGIFGRITLGSFYAQPELLITSHQSSYSFEDLANPGEVQFRSESGVNFDVPLIVGVKLGGFRVQAGPVASMNLSQKSDFIEKDAWERNFQNADWGLQMGVGVDIGQIFLDLNYHLPLKESTEGINVGGQSYQLNSSKGQIVVAVGLSLL